MPEPIFEPGPVPTPFVYTVSGTGEVVPRTCQAVYDGSGAGGDYIPAVIFRSQAGHVIARAILQSTVTAGDDAEVSWFPGVKAATAAAATTQSWLRVVCDTAVPSGAIPLDNGTVPTISTFDTNDSARFAQTDTKHWSMTNGTYQIDGEVIASGSAVTAVNGDFVAGVRSGEGYAVSAFAGNGSRAVETAFASMTIGDQGTIAPWHGILTGSDTHAWSVHAYIVYVQGT